MIVILDGPRGSGKTTIASRLSGFRLMKFPRTHEWMSTPFHSPIHGLAAQIDILSQISENIVLDRFVGSEWVMRQAIRPFVTTLYLENLLRVDGYLEQKCHPLQIICTAPKDIRMARTAKPDEGDVDELWAKWFEKTSVVETVKISTASDVNVAMKSVWHHIGRMMRFTTDLHADGTD